MWRRIVYAIIALILTVWTAVPAVAQPVLGLDLKGEIHGQPEINPSGYSVHLIDTAHRVEIASADADMMGRFSLRSVPQGDYILRITNTSGSVIREELVRLDGTNSVLQINLPTFREPARPSAGRVSIRQLRNPPSKQAIRAFVQAQKHSEAGRSDKAAAELEKAIRLSPDFAEAHTNLGAQYIRMRRYEEAIEESQRAMTAGSPNIHDLCNRGLAEWALGRPDDAVRSAWQALRLNGSAPIAHYIIGTILSMQPERRNEGIRHLERAAEHLPAAARNLERVRPEAGAR